MLGALGMRKRVQTPSFHSRDARSAAAAAVTIGTVGDCPTNRSGEMDRHRRGHLLRLHCPVIPPFLSLSL